MRQIPQRRRAAAPVLHVATDPESESDARLERLFAGVPELELTGRRVSRMQPNWNDLYVRMFPLLLPLGPVFGLLGREVEGPGGDVVRLSFVRRAHG